MDYSKHYNILIARAKERKINGYTEVHHIIPKCIGGTDDKTNLVPLTAREHYVAHQLLAKIYPNEYGLIKAVQMMSQCNWNNKCRNNRMYEWVRIRFAKAMSIQMSIKQKGELNSQFGKIWIYNDKLEKSIRVYPDEFTDELVENGWVKGRKINFGKKEIIKKSPKPRRKTPKTWVSNLNLKKSLLVDSSLVNEYLDNGYIKVRILDFDKYFERQKLELKRKQKNGVEALKSKKREYAIERFIEFINGDFKSIVEYTLLKYNSSDITRIRYLWITYVNGFDEFIKLKKRNNGISSEVLREYFGDINRNWYRPGLENQSSSE